MDLSLACETFKNRIIDILVKYHIVTEVSPVVAPLHPMVRRSQVQPVSE